MTQTRTLFVGVDGGGSGCRVAIADGQGTVIGAAQGGPANYTTDPVRSVKNVLATLEKAVRVAGLEQDAIKGASAHLGLAGIVSPEDAQSMAASLPFTRCVVSADHLTSVIGALGNRNGAVIAVGTGSFIGVKRDRDIRTIGGWGLHLGDQASGAWLGRQILQRCALVRDGIAQSSDLVERLLTQFGNEPGELIAFARQATPAGFAELAAEVMAAADIGDSNATQVLREASEYLNRGLTSLDMDDEDVLCLTGGLGGLYRPWLDASFQARIAEPRGTALDGALQLARENVQSRDDPKPK